MSVVSEVWMRSLTGPPAVTTKNNVYLITVQQEGEKERQGESGMISCNLYDYIEIACMHKYSVRITLKDARVIEGVATDTSLDSNRNECIKIQQGSQTFLVILQEIAELEVPEQNPHFNHISFS